MRGFLPLLLLFVFVPLAELYLLIELGSVLGGLSTIALCLFTAALGAWLVRAQGFQTLTRAQNNLSDGQLPAVEMFEGIFIVVAGVLLLVPGLITDLIGFACLIPPLRRFLIHRVMSRRNVSGSFSNIKIDRGIPRPGADPSSSARRGGSNTIDAEFERVHPKTESDVDEIRDDNNRDQNS